MSKGDPVDLVDGALVRREFFLKEDVDGRGGRGKCDGCEVAILIHRVIGDRGKQLLIGSAVADEDEDFVGVHRVGRQRKCRSVGGRGGGVSLPPDKGRLDVDRKRTEVGSSSHNKRARRGGDARRRGEVDERLGFQQGQLRPVVLVQNLDLRIACGVRPGQLLTGTPVML